GRRGGGPRGAPPDDGFSCILRAPLERRGGGWIPKVTRRGPRGSESSPGRTTATLGRWGGRRAPPRERYSSGLAGRWVSPIREASTPRAASRPSPIAPTTSHWPPRAP